MLLESASKFAAKLLRGTRRLRSVANTAHAEYVSEMGAAEKILEEVMSLNTDEREKLAWDIVRKVHGGNARAEAAYWTAVLQDQAKVNGTDKLTDEEIEAEIQAVRHGR